ncbi:ATP-binding protein [Shewanella sp. AS16]|uniref:ATP-binding protein n=1 Tax=Shewanella sp. AS16 TaxID=2907625 RepID=UPI001F40E998|nr:ATP-binding protein [Shewanella sp. AS16]MCE9685402.1 ATP-binding protein [Shewanella sp. AS16]
MKRLFISLYLLLSLSLLGIGWTLDSLWQQHVDDNGVLDAPLLALAQVLAQLPVAERQTYLQAIDTRGAMPLQLLTPEQLALPQQRRLTRGELFTTTTPEGRQLQFVGLGTQVLVAGPIDMDPRAESRGLFTLLFYLALALVILLWVAPLSRDLRILRRATEAFGEAKWDTRIALSSRSQVRPLGNTFNDMARRIGTLIDNQRHLSNAVSHEIRTPLARLKFALALLAHAGHADKRRQLLEGMGQDVAEMESLLQELLTYASLETQPQTPGSQPIELLALVRQTIARVQDLGIQAILLHARQEQIRLQCEPALLERALQNLLTNAQRFARTAIRVEVGLSQGMITLAVSNDGPPIPEEERQRLFEPFYRGTVADGEHKGHGLGLAIVKRIMTRHRGRVTLDSESGETRFSLIWPQSQEH